MAHLKILHLISGLQPGGTEGVLCRLIESSKGRFTHSVVSLSGEGYYGPLLRNGGVALYCAHLGKNFNLHRGIATVLSAIRQTEPDVIQTWLYHADFVGASLARIATSCPVCWGIRGDRLSREALGGRTWLLTRLNARLSGIPARIVSCSERAAREHQAIGYKADRFQVIPNGFDVTRFAPQPEQADALRKLWAVPSSMPLLGMAARWDLQKDHRNLLSALKVLKERGHEFRCVLAGSGMEESNPALMSLIAEAGLTREILLLGRRQDLPAIYSALDLHVLSSLGEGFPNVVAEAMAAGVPCAVTDVGDAAAIVGDLGWVSPARNAEALANAIEQGLAAVQSPRKEVLSRDCRARITAEYGLDKMASAFGQVWTECARF